MPEDASGDGTDTRDGRDAGSESTEGWSTDSATDSEPPDWEPEQASDSQAERERIPLDLSGPESDPDQEVADGTDDTDEYVPEPSSAPIEAGDPDLEHAIFVLLGAIVMLLVIARLLALPLG